MPGRPDRRRFLQLLASGGFATTAGCLGETDDAPGDDEDTLEPVEVSAESNEEEDPTHTITVRYDTVTHGQSVGGGYDIAASDGHKLVVMEARLTVTSVRRDELQIREESIGLRAAGNRYEPQPISGLPFFKNAVIPPANFQAWGWFEVPADVTRATLVPVQPGTWYGVPTTLIFEHDDSIKVSL